MSTASLHHAPAVAVLNSVHSASVNTTSLTWRACPIKQQWRRLGPVIALLLIGVPVLCAVVSGPWWLGGLAAVLIALSMWRMLAPVEYELSPRGFVYKFAGRARVTRWREIGRAQAQDSGVLLLGTHEPIVWDWLRATYVPWGEHREQVLALVHAYLGERFEIGAQETQSIVIGATSPTAAHASTASHDAVGELNR